MGCEEEAGGPGQGQKHRDEQRELVPEPSGPLCLCPRPSAVRLCPGPPLPLGAQPRPSFLFLLLLRPLGILFLVELHPAHAQRGLEVPVLGRRKRAGGREEREDECMGSGPGFCLLTSPLPFLRICVHAVFSPRLPGLASCPSHGFYGSHRTFQATVSAPVRGESCSLRPAALPPKPPRPSCRPGSGC